jgi:hypothetical protein
VAVLFLFIFAEYLKNHSKSQKNHKIENLIFVGLHMSKSNFVGLHMSKSNFVGLRMDLLARA